MNRFALTAALLLAGTGTALRAAPAKSRPRTELVQTDTKYYTAGFPKGWKRYAKETRAAHIYQGYYWCPPFKLEMDEYKGFCGTQTRPETWITAMIGGPWDNESWTDANWSSELIRTKTCKGGHIVGDPGITSSWCGRMAGRRVIDGAEAYMFIDDTTRSQPGDLWNPVEPDLKSVYIIMRVPKSTREYHRLIEMQFIAPAAEFDGYLDDIEAIIRSVRFKRG